LVAVFAEKLFGETFEYDINDASRQDVIKADRKKITNEKQHQWEPKPELYTSWLKTINETGNSHKLIHELAAIGISFGVPNSVIEKAANLGLKSGYEEFLYQALINNAHLNQLQSALENEPVFLESISRQIFGDIEQRNIFLTALVDLSNRAKSQESAQPLLPARYHMFVRAIEGAFLELAPFRKIFLERIETVEHNNEQYPVFEIATCRQCGATYLVGEIEELEFHSRLKQPGAKYFENRNNLNFYLLLDEHTDISPFDEDDVPELVNEEVSISDKVFRLCARCGAIGQDNQIGVICECTDPIYHSVIYVPSKEGRVHLCPACGRSSPSGLVRRFTTGNDATASVLATALYQEIPPSKSGETGLVSVPIDDPWLPAPSSQAIKTANDEGGMFGRQLLIFSDSRQDAAFFAPYLNRTYEKILSRRLILKTIEENREDVVQNKWRIKDLVLPLQRMATEYGFFADESRQGQKSGVWKWLLYELLTFETRNSLEGLGLLGFGLAKPRYWQAPPPLLAYGFSEEEVWTLYSVLLDTLRRKGAIRFPDFVSPTDEYFAPRNREYAIVGKRSSGTKRASNITLLGWSPATSSAINARLDYLRRIFSAMGNNISESEPRELLDSIWIRTLTRRDAPWSNYFEANVSRSGDVYYQLKHDFWELRPGLIDPSIHWYSCDTCANLTMHSIRGVCPTYRCEGHLDEIDIRDFQPENHYRKLYTELKAIPLVAKEHTAQLTSEAAAELQSEFVEGKVNVLSCSTTFELGVDVGELETVFMRNVPPSAANYIQRAGRAGRRTSSTAFALTFAQRRSHDLTHFSDPLRLISGKILAPYFNLTNEKIVRRHVYATALANFWKRYPDTYGKGKVESFFFQESLDAVELLTQFLNDQPSHLYRSIEGIVPFELWDELDIEHWGWIDGLVGSNGVLTLAAIRVHNDVDNLEDARSQLIEQGKPSDFLLRTINTIKRTYLISYLSRQNVIPKYGFPVDVVSLQISHHSQEARMLELDRDLKIALSEYAPGSQVVAGGKLWTSRYLKRLPKRNWRSYKYGQKITGFVVSAQKKNKQLIKCLKSDG
jgi:hypothetical protein